MVRAAFLARDTMGRAAISVGRLRAAAEAAASKALAAKGKVLKVDLPEGLIKCAYLGVVEEGAKLRCVTRVNFEWSAGELGSVVQTIYAGKALLRAGFVPPWEFRLPLHIACLPLAIAMGRLLPGMSKHEEVACRGLAIPREYEAELETTVAVRGGRRQEHLKCAHVSGNKEGGLSAHPHRLRTGQADGAGRTGPRCILIAIPEARPGCAIQEGR